MTDWATLEDRFGYLSELDLAHRERELEAIAEDSPELASQLRGMLAADDQTTLQIGERIQRMASSVMLDGELGQGDRIGPWCVIERIGRGGMGTVYKVERADDQFRQIAALKVVSNVADEPTYDRFRRERQILAQLSHPNIAGLIDGGVIDDGRPWLVMEYVEGLSVDRWCDQQQLGIADRLELFLQVLDAVSFAHRKLVLHKDIKLGNILVNDSGQIRLLDFGTASLLDDESGSPEAATRVFALTPAFASPEQVRGEPLSTASDIYSLGVVLYYLLTGRMPLSEQSRSAAEFERVVSLKTPPLPSAAVSPGKGSDNGDDLGRKARCRHSAPTRLRNRLRGDLDAITMTCLRKEPERRYSSVQMLAADIRAHLDARPVSARTDSRLYRVARIASAYRWQLGSGLALVLMLATGMTLSIVNYLEAEQRGKDLERVVTFQQRLIEAMDPRMLGEEALAWIVSDPDAPEPSPALRESVNPADLGRRLIDRQLLAGSTGLIDDLFDDRPGLGLQMHLAMGRLYQRLDLHQGVIDATMGAAAMAETDDDQATALRMRLFAAEAHKRLEQYDHAADILEIVLAHVDELDGEDDRLRVLALATKLEGDLLTAANQPDAALAAYRTSLDHRMAIGDATLQRVVRYDIAVTLHRMGRLEQALTEARRLAADWEDAVGKDHARTQTARNLVATALSSLGQVEEALGLQRSIHDFRQRQLGDENQFTLVALNNIGVSYKRLGQFEDALETFERVYIARRDLFGPTNTYTIATAMRRGETLKRLERLEEAKAIFGEVVDLANTENSLARQGALARLHLEEIRARRGQATDADQARQLAEQLTAEGTHWMDAFQPLQLLGRILAAAGDLDGAERVLEQALAQQIDLLGPDHAKNEATRRSLNEVADARRAGDAEPVIVTPGRGSF